jgi:hypothetical protein
MGIRIRDIVKPGSGMEKIGYGINIQNPQHWCSQCVSDIDPKAVRSIDPDLETQISPKKRGRKI